MKKYIFITLIILMCVTPVAANVTYPQEYYEMVYKSNDILNNMLDDGAVGFANYGAQLFQSFELRRQTILMEKQNELQAELVKAQWVETCYAQKYYTIAVNYSAWKSECANAGYPVG